MPANHSSQRKRIYLILPLQPYQFIMVSKYRNSDHFRTWIDRYRLQLYVCLQPNIVHHFTGDHNESKGISNFLGKDGCHRE